ncbi:C69 family dipeptidase [Simiduia agarivorans]|uniref:Dipeptidase n=1 Tax=Simiduia agarivorans (strain DSM 21679 / JCM 13881 / BCRC 17597 / SA1) TaxID=1117647 RepID=K4KNX6_SIMAS|nr:C69 family dipeptidase [Simiduia agarivorans]AFU99813.1 peptidase U34, dipeptidase [Simiduia agarivorans SA1 = DSM 21679]
MCDTFAFAHGGGVWFGKNSDREPDEPQRVEYVAPVTGDPSASLPVTYITIDQQPDRFGYLMGRPDWLWGAEMGVNDQGLAVGNEAVFTAGAGQAEPALLGMDLVRLALERAATARDGVTVITGLLARYGQGGAAGYRNKRFRYDNSFLLADAREIWQVETAGKAWVARPYSLAAISNSFSLQPPFSLHSPDQPPQQPFRYRNKRLMTWLAGAEPRRQCALRLAGRLQKQAAVEAAEVMAILRTHARADRPTGNRDLCMHAGGPHRPSETTNAMVAWLGPAGPKVWFTGCPQPCCSEFQPVAFDAIQVAQTFGEGFWEQQRGLLDGLTSSERRERRAWAGRPR